MIEEEKEFLGINIYYPAIREEFRYRRAYSLAH